jgi:hypothetical protein
VIGEGLRIVVAHFKGWELASSAETLAVKEGFVLHILGEDMAD